MKFAPIVTIAIIAMGWTRTIPAQPPVARASGALAMLDSGEAPSPGIGRDWRRFGSGLEEDRPMVARIRLVASVEDNHPFLWVDRFGSGLEDDAPVHTMSVLNQPGF